LDENLHSYLEGSEDGLLKIFITLSKTEKTNEVLKNFKIEEVNFLKGKMFDIYLIRDCDAVVIAMALSEEKPKKKHL
jgi:hypothetical protein